MITGAREYEPKSISIDTPRFDVQPSRPAPGPNFIPSQKTQYALNKIKDKIRSIHTVSFVEVELIDQDI